MHSSRWRVLPFALAVLVLLAAPPGAGGQTPESSGLAVEVAAGGGVPIEDLGAWHDTGPAASLAVTVPLSRSWGGRLQAGGAYLLGGGWGTIREILAPGVPREGPDHPTAHLHAGLEYRPLAGDDRRWRLRLDGTIGVTGYRLEETPYTKRITDVNPSAQFGIAIGRRLGGSAELFARGGWHLEWRDRGAADDHLGKEMTLPFVVGLRIGG